MRARSVSIADSIEKVLVDLIIDGKLQPGDQLPSENLMIKRLGVSRLPLRESIARLTAAGLLKTKQGKGIFVRERVRESALCLPLFPLQPHRYPDRLKSLLEARRFLEGEISASAASNPDTSDLEELERLAHYDTKVIESVETFVVHDEAFHDHVARMTKNDYLILMFCALSPFIRKVLISHKITRQERAAALDHHKEIADAIRRKDSRLSKVLAIKYTLNGMGALA